MGDAITLNTCSYIYIYTQGKKCPSRANTGCYGKFKYFLRHEGKKSVDYNVTGINSQLVKYHICHVVWPGPTLYKCFLCFFDVPSLFECPQASEDQNQDREASNHGRGTREGNHARGLGGGFPGVQDPHRPP